jgi:hypothetical protein
MVRSQDGLMEVLTGVMPPSTPASQLKNDREIWVVGCDIDGLTNTVDEHDMSNPGIAESFNNLGSLLGTRDSCCEGNANAVGDLRLDLGNHHSKTIHPNGMHYDWDMDGMTEGAIPQVQVVICR